MSIQFRLSACNRGKSIGLGTGTCYLSAPSIPGTAVSHCIPEIVDQNGQTYRFTTAYSLMIPGGAHGEAYVSTPSVDNVAHPE